PILKPFLRVLGFFGNVLATPVSTGAKNQLWAAVSPEAKSGEFYHPVGVAGKVSNNSRDQGHEEDIWKWTEKELEGHG
ncbi:hypothetical protein BKA56DRAFT_499613, partial [Ilyonectria sp. MPI-CAGE-AT-0026]